MLEGQIDFAVSSRPLKPQEYTRAKQQGFNLSQHQVAIDGIAVAVNHTLPVDGISIESLRQIYLGQLTNWSQLVNIPLHLSQGYFYLEFFLLLLV